MPASCRFAVCLVLAIATMAGSPRASVAQVPAGCGASEIFTTQALSPMGVVQRHVRAADLNGDGLLDLVVSTSSSLVIELGTPAAGGTVAYQPSFSYPGFSDPTGTAIADFDGDGIKDIALVADGGGLYLFRGLGAGGHGNGQFNQYSVFNLGSAWDVAAGDINGDGITDLVVALRGGAIVPMIGQGANGVGNGQFALRAAIAAPGSPKGMALVDLDLDGVLDVVTTSESNTVSVLRGQTTAGVPNGGFVLAATISMSGSTFDVAVADFNGDGYPDIASANYDGANISVSLGGPQLAFKPGISHGSPGTPLGIAAGDFNHDGRPDLVVSAANGGVGFTYFQNTGATPASPDGFSNFVTYGAPRIGYGMAAADLNHDASLDVVAPSVGETTLLVAFNACTPARPVLFTTAIGHGTITRAPDQPAYDQGQVVQVTAVPDPGYQFTGWSVDLSGTTNPNTVTMNGSRTVVATFIPIQHALTVTIAGAGQGTVTRTPDRPTYDVGSTVHLVAVPAFGNVFAGWTGAATSPDTAIDLVMSVDRAVTATFLPDTTILPHIVSITDVPLDQGGKVKLRWLASTLETPGSDPQNLVTQYFVWREIPQAAFVAAQQAAQQAAISGANAGGLYLHTATAARDYFWEFVVSLPGSRFAGYSYTAVTTNDSTAQGNPETAFMVQARNAAATRWWSSPPDSGYSVDNLAPPAPGPVVASYGASANTLHWGPSHAPDLAGYRIHRGVSVDFTPNDTNLIGAPSDTAFVDPQPGASFYKLAAVDLHGNTSSFLLVSPVVPVGVLGEDVRFALAGAAPNPALGGRMSVRFTLPSAAPATLELLDVNGRRVDLRALSGQAGPQTAELGSATRIPPGLYWIRLQQAGRQTATRALVLQ